MKIIHTSDWHIGKRLNEHDLLSDQRQVLTQWIEEVASKKPDLVIIAGDLYDRSLPSQEAVGLVDELFVKMAHELSCPVTLISGNHDNGRRVGYGGYFFEQQGIYVAGQPERVPKRVAVGQADVYLLPFAYPATIRDLYEDPTIKTVIDAVKRQVAEIKKIWDPKRLNILVYHGSVTANVPKHAGEDVAYASEHHLLSVGTVEFVPVSLFEGFDYIALGHIHNAQQIGSAPCYYSGSPLKYSKNEADQIKQYYEVDLNKETCQVMPHLIYPKHPLRTERGTFHDLLNGTPSEDYLYFELTDKTAQTEAMSRLRQVYPNAMSLQYVDLAHSDQPLFNSETNVRTTTHAKDLVSYYQEFYQQMMGEALSEQQETMVRELLQTLEEE
ncbi:MAG: exonuclease SbcCD subunit D [Aerococcus sp.]|nr:exonuclease SbcCD subunit D [Aerococcus sp.]